MNKIFKFILMLYILVVLVPGEICPNSIHPRFKRIANGPPKHKHKSSTIIKRNPWGAGDSSFFSLPQNTTTEEEEVVEKDPGDYPSGYFLQPGQTDAPDTYDYDEKKFNKPHLVNPEWKNDVTTRNRTYDVEQSKLHGILPLESIKSPEPVKSIFGDDIL